MSEPERKKKKQDDQPVGLPLLSLPEKDADPSKENKQAVKDILSWVIIFVSAIAVALLIQQFVVETLRVDGQSMNNTLQHNEFILVSKLDYLTSEPQRLDVVNCRFPGREGLYVKRIVGIPGDTVEINSEGVFINGELLEEEYITYPAEYTTPLITLGPDQYFVLGDNRNRSTDSHSIGPIDRKDIISKGKFVIYPFENARPIEASESTESPNGLTTP